MKYKDLEKKYKLPSLKKLELEFDFELKEENSNPSKILGKLEDYFESYCDKIQILLHADGNIESLHECEFLNESEKGELFNIFKDFMSLRRGIQSAILGNIQEQCDLILNSHKSQQKSKNTLKVTFKKLSDKWKENKENKNESMKYFG